MRQILEHYIFSLECFNPRICKRCDGLEVQLTKAQAVSIHASVKDATWGRSGCFWGNQCFNPRICKRCDASSIKWAYKRGVSIHASVKDATATGVKIRGYVVVSIHASVKDATTFTTDDTRATRFQSTHL